MTRIMVRAEGHYRLADLATGTLADGTLGQYSGPSALIPRPSDGWLCVCGTWTAYGSNGPTGLSMTLVPIDPNGQAGDRVEVRRVEGTADPDERIDLQFQLVDGSVGVAPDSSTAFFAWTARNGSAGWTGGIDVIDVATGTVVSSRSLPLIPPVRAEGGPVSRNAPSVKLSPAGDRILMASFWFVEDPIDSNPPAGTDHWTATVEGRVVGEINPLVGTSAEDCIEFDSGPIDSNSYYLICASQSGELTVRRLTLDGTAIGETKVARVREEFFGSSQVAISGHALYIWDPVAAFMSRVDLQSGELTTSQAGAASVQDPLDSLAALGRRLGHWIAPSILAKMLLEPAIVVSPDGARVYAIGVSSPARTDRGSTGIFAFDAASLALTGQWAPTADFTSIAVSADGRFVYAAAQGGVDATGASSSNGASVTVFDATDGSVRLIAGELGSTDLWFANARLD